MPTSWTAQKADQRRRRRAQERAEREPEFRFCLWCNEGFERSRSDQWFCSTRCRVASHRAEKRARNG
jgi:predicted nucleic acid-binding Zn ribbon protein